MRSKGDSASPEGQHDTGLILNIVIIKVRAQLPRTFAVRSANKD